MENKKEKGIRLCILAAREFVIKVETGLAQSKDSYGKFKRAIFLIESGDRERGDRPRREGEGGG
ncbi:hypothetical protein LCGC14_0427760 [marine sediment metagenome]|uniref:Uncharacterized protein n=1 Tax=marine sediment metagenome TaxID=412755 RepID=A0A0F9VB71_9ZZZZ